MGLTREAAIEMVEKKLMYEYETSRKEVRDDGLHFTITNCL